MIARTWRAMAAADRRHLYVAHFTVAVLPKLRNIPGFAGAYLLERDMGLEVEFVVQSLWESADAVARFAGPDLDVAVVDVEAEAMLLGYDRAVVHHTVLIAPA